MLAAIGRDRVGAYLVALAPGRTPTGRVDPDLQATLAELMRRRIALAAPRRLILLGDATTRALTGTNLAEARGGERPINHGAGMVPAITTFHPRFLLQQPARKADAWRDLLRLPEAERQ
jgi:uracil-DNA glycosylase family 4